MRPGFLVALGISCLCSFSPSALAQSNPVKFQDLAGDRYAKEIELAVEQGLVSGFSGSCGVAPCANRTFRPQASLTREQLLSMVVDAMFKVPLQNTNDPRSNPVLPALPTNLTTHPFPDVDRAHWSADKIAYGKTLGLIRGYKDGTFRPTQPVTRAELIVMLQAVDDYLVKFRGGWDGRQYVPMPTALSFSDTQTHWARSRIEQMSTNCTTERRVASFLNETGTRFAPDTIAQRNYAAAATLRAVQCLSFPLKSPS